MTRRVVISILLTVWAVFIVGGLFAWFSAKSILIADLDAILFARAAALPELTRPNAQRTDIPQYDWGDHFTIRDDSGRSVASEDDLPTTPETPRLLRTYDSISPAGKRQRSVVISAWARSDGGPSERVTVTYSGSTAHVDRALQKLAWALSAFVLMGGLVTAAVAALVSRFALGRLKKTAEVLRDVDEHRLYMRLPTASLPTELTPVAQRVNELLARLEDAFTQRQQFIADASHELRTPVAALVTMLEIASRHPQDPEGYRRTIEQLLGDAQLLRKLVERLMEHAGSERAGNEAPEETDISDLLNSCANIAEQFGAAKESRVIRTIPRGLCCVIHGERLRSIITNLLSNAVEYVHAGGTIQLTAIHDGEQLRLSIRDNGPGIAPEHLPKLFDPFYRVDKFSGEEHLGLGLFIVRRHVRAMHGEVRVESQLGVGTTFFVDLPCKVVADKDSTSRPDLLSAAL